MMLMSVETSTLIGGIAIADDRRGLISESLLNVKSTHSERLMSAVHLTLAQAEISLKEIDAFAVSVGPGSFTGLRIGLSTVKGLAYAMNKPLVTVPTLEAFAWNFPFARYPVCLMLDARKGEVYTALFEWEQGGFRKLLGEISIDAGELCKKIKGTVICAGEGAILYRGTIEALLGERAVFAPDAKMLPSPANVAMIGLEKALRKEFADTVASVPLYIRKSEAEVKWERKH